MSIRVGMRAVCIFDGWITHPKCIGAPMPSKGDICTVSGVTIDSWGTLLQLSEYLPTSGFDASYFRPVHTIESDAELFKSLLRPADPIELCEAFESNLTDIEAAMERAWKR